MTARRTPRARKTGAKKKTTRKSAVKPRATTKVQPFRLDPDVRPHDVDLHIDVDPQKSAVFRGEVQIEVTSRRSRRKIELHAADLQIRTASARDSNGDHRAQIALHPRRQTVELRFPKPLCSGELTLRLTFTGRLRKDLCGFYGAEVRGSRYAFTQLEAADARKFFPCFDEPAMKARFALTVTTAEGHAVLSNSPEEDVEFHDDGRKTVRFERTPPLSSYLVALAVGDLEVSRTAKAGRTPIRVWHVPGKNGLTAFALEAARETLMRLERYFAMPYPYAKLDLVAVPDFEFGAMENAGAVFFRETLLLTDPQTVTLAEKKRAAEVICHELAHMWFGDLVTMAWWDDLWLNEAFATWMAFWIVDRWKPEWKMWHDFQHYRAPALDLDGLRNTHPIYTTVRTPDDANANFDVITYEKGASVVRMIERYLGEAAFRRGVRHYIKKHRESNAVASDLWQALEEASGESVEPVVRTWIETPGFPVVSVEKRKTQGETLLELRQERFTEAPPRDPKPHPQRWPVPWVGRVGRRTQRHLLTKRRERIELSEPSAKVLYGNADEAGFFRVQHGEHEHAELIANPSRLSVAERIGWVGHQWALTRTGRASIASLLEIAHTLADDSDPDVLTAVERPLSILSKRVVPASAPGVAERFEGFVLARFAPLLEELGWGSGPREAQERRLLRARLLAIVAGIGNEPTVGAEASRRCGAYLADRDSLDPNLADTVVQIAATRGGVRLYGRLHRASRHARTPQEARRFLLALADFQDAELIDRTLELVLTDQVATQDVAFVLVRLFLNPSATQQTWEFIQRRWSRLSHRMPALMANRLIEVTPQLGTSAYRREVAAFFRSHPLPSGERSLRQALERFDSWTRFQRRATREFEAFLSKS